MTATAAETDRWIKTESDRVAVEQGCFIDLDAARRPVEFFSKLLVHSKGQFANQAFELLPWQRENIIEPLFGWRRADGTRRFRKAGIWVPKKNGKSTLMSGLSLYMLLADGEAGAEVYNAANDRKQAGIVFDEAANMVKKSAELSKVLKVIPSTKRITFERTSSWYQALSAEVKTKEGLNANLVIFDEIHRFKNRDLWATLTYAGAARRQPLQVSISTAGDNRHGIGYEQYKYAKDVLNGTIIDTAFLPCIYEATAEDDWTDEATWFKANPSLGVTVNLDGFRDSFREAINSPLKQNDFRRYHLNQWVQQQNRWINPKKWEACPSEPFTLDDLAGRECFAGLDLSSTTDLTALSLAFPNDDGSYHVLPFFWCPEETVQEHERSDGVSYSYWVKQGLIKTTPGSAIDYDRIRAFLNELNTKVHIRKVAVDPWNAQQLATQLDGDGFDVCEFRQGYASMSSPTKEFEKLVLAEKIRHGGNPVLLWQVDNVAVDQDAAGNLKPAKNKSTERIDGVVATIMALGIAAQTPASGGYYLHVI
jgi:phage terminase large subunit-like protein